MIRRFEPFPVTVELKESLAKRLSRKAEIFAIESDPLLASLISCLGFQFEIGRVEWDRLSSALSIDLSRYPKNPWCSEIISLEGEIGIRMWIPEHAEFLPRHEDFSRILHPLSLDSTGRLTQIVIFPAAVARQFRQRALELVIVRDWPLDTFLNPGPSVNYLIANERELERNIALTQAKLITRGRLAFFGTHDLADHLLGGGSHGFVARMPLYLEVQAALERSFPSSRRAKNRSLLISYLIGVLLDDFAQPVWYESIKHEALLKTALGLLSDSENTPGDLTELVLPIHFHRLIGALRDEVAHVGVDVEEVLGLFVTDLFRSDNTQHVEAPPAQAHSPVPSESQDSVRRSARS